MKTADLVVGQVYVKASPNDWSCGYSGVEVLLLSTETWHRVSEFGGGYRYDPGTLNGRRGTDKVGLPCAVRTRVPFLDEIVWQPTLVKPGQLRGTPAERDAIRRRSDAAAKRTRLAETEAREEAESLIQRIEPLARQLGVTVSTSVFGTRRAETSLADMLKLLTQAAANQRR